MEKPDYSEYAEPLPTELEQIVDEARADVGRGPAKRNPQQGIDDMKARIEYHTTLIGKCRAQLKSGKLSNGQSVPPKHAEDLHKIIANGERQITDAKARLKEYELQSAGQN